MNKKKILNDIREQYATAVANGDELTMIELQGAARYITNYLPED